MIQDYNEYVIQIDLMIKGKLKAIDIINYIEKFIVHPCPYFVFYDIKN